MKIEDMDVSKLAHEMTLKIYKITSSFPDVEKYRLSSQMRRAATETDYWLLLSADLGFIDRGGKSL